MLLIQKAIDSVILIAALELAGNWLHPGQITKEMMHFVNTLDATPLSLKCG
jgi:hypothetical protein